MTYYFSFYKKLNSLSVALYRTILYLLPDFTILSQYLGDDTGIIRLLHNGLSLPLSVFG